MARDRRRVVQAAAVAAVLGGAPSMMQALARTRSIRATGDTLLDATTRIGVLVPPFRQGLVQGVLAHAVVSVLAGEALGHVLPGRHSTVWGAAAGFVMGVVNVGIIGRRIPAIAELPLGPQLADNVGFGVVFAAVADRGRS